MTGYFVDFSNIVLLLNKSFLWPANQIIPDGMAIF